MRLLSSWTVNRLSASAIFLFANPYNKPTANPVEDTPIPATHTRCLKLFHGHTLVHRKTDTQQTRQRVIHRNTLLTDAWRSDVFRAWTKHNGTNGGYHAKTFIVVSQCFVVCLNFYQLTTNPLKNTYFQHTHTYRRMTHYTQIYP